MLVGDDGTAEPTTNCFQARAALLPPEPSAGRSSHWSRRCALVTANTAVVSTHTP
ncbi:hypothetical protein ACFWCR_21290 [Streptomyces goshikiensis]|uniref:hypothetical protein n=1 Tax=Streptomyces goshikiensis TaxID=1942 RepID=UPI00367B8516